MAESKHTFLGGRMDKDTDSRLIEKGLYRDALNMRAGKSSGSDIGAIENELSNKKLTNLEFGTNPVTIGMYADTAEEKIYWFVASDGGASYVVEHSMRTSITTKVLSETTSGVLNFSKDNLITGVNLVVDTDEERRLLYWTDGINSPKGINIERAKGYAVNGFVEADVTVIKAAPLYPPAINLGTTSDGTENNLEEKFIRFSYRYKYLDGEYSAIAPFSNVAFNPKPFSYDYAVSTNVSMVNAYNKVSIGFNSGDKRVTDVEVIFKESGSNTLFLIDRYNKEDKGWGDSQAVSIEFFNNKIRKALSENEVFRLFDAVPLTAKAQEIIGNRLVYGNYTEGMDIADSDGDINVDFSLTAIATTISNQTGTPSLKSNRDYEIGIAYTDSQGRMTPVLTSEHNTIAIPNSDSPKQNQIQVSMDSKAPAEATHFRFFLKQTREDYESIVPTLFYEDGVYVWIKLEGDEDNKVTEGDFLYVKADSQEILSNIVQTRVLEIKAQPKDFLENTESQESGNYMRIKPSNFRIDEDDFTLYTFEGYDNSSNSYDNPIRSNTNYIEEPVYYGTQTSNDLTVSGTFSSSEDLRFLIEIVALGTPDTFRHSIDNGDNWSPNTAITGAAQLLSNGVSITFGSTTGHAVDDEWVVSAKSSVDDNFGGREETKAYGIFKSLDATIVNETDIIEGGARIKIVYDEYGDTTQKVERDYVSTRRYANLEEWFFRDNIIDDIGGVINESRIWFRRGNVGTTGNANYITIDSTGEMCMIIESAGTQNNGLDERAKVKTELEIFQSEQAIIFETVPLLNDGALFFEIGRTYEVVDGYHTSTNAGDSNQSNGVAGVFTLDTFNCFSWGNAFESYKIKDLFNAKAMKIDSRASDSLEDYGKSIRIASLTYSNVYEQTTNYNGLNEFNLANINFFELDDKYKSIQKLHSKDTDLTVFQEDKVLRLPYQKDVLFDATGTGTVRQSTSVLGTPIPYLGEFGISLNPESFAVYGNSIYFTDVRRGVVMRLNRNGLIPISEIGMRDYFRDSFRDLSETKKIGAMDLYNKQYVLHVDDTQRVEELVVECGAIINKINAEVPYSWSVNQTAGEGTIRIDYVTTGEFDIDVDIDGQGTLVQNAGLNGTGFIEIAQTNTDVSSVEVTVTPVTTPIDYSVQVACNVPVVPPVSNIEANDVTDVCKEGLSRNMNVIYNDVYSDPITVTVPSQPSRGSAVVEADNSITYTHVAGDTSDVVFSYMIDDGNSTDPAFITVEIKVATGGGGSQASSFSISSTSFINPGATSNGEGACTFSLTQTMYHDGSGVTPTLGDKVYTDAGKFFNFNGSNEYWAVAGGRTLKIDTQGEVLDVWVCGAGNA